MSRKMSRRDFIKLLTVGTGGIVIASCTPETVTVIETKEVIKEVTATAPPVVQAQVADVKTKVWFATSVAFFYHYIKAITKP